jgi:hypothetical protein
VCPEAPSFLPDLPVEDTSFEPYCQPIPKYGTEEEALISVLEKGFVDDMVEETHLRRPWRANIREYLQAYRCGKEISKYHPYFTFMKARAREDHYHHSCHSFRKSCHSSPAVDLFESLTYVHAIL